MENTGKRTNLKNRRRAGIFGGRNAQVSFVHQGRARFLRSKVAHVIALALLVFVAGRGSLMDGCFPVAVALVACGVWKNVTNVYLLLPAAAAILMHIPKGYDSWSDLAAVVACALIFASARRIKLDTWQAAMIAASTAVICTGAGRFVTLTVYKISAEKLFLYGLLVFALFFMLDVASEMWQHWHDGIEVRGTTGTETVGNEEETHGGNAYAHKTSRQLKIAASVSLCFMILNGIGATFLAWPIIILLALTALVYLDTEASLLTAVTGSAWAALMGQAQWGALATLVMALVAAGFVKHFGGWACVITSALVCYMLGYGESGVVLGLEKYSLLLAVMVLAVSSWRFGNSIRSGAARLFGRDDMRELMSAEIDGFFGERAQDMRKLAELYSSYFDSRSVLANQFEITEQIIEEAKRRTREIAGKSVVHSHIGTGKIDVDIAISQCAASGEINGDCCGWQDIGSGRVAMVISDGMGKGKRAAAESLLVTKTMLSLLRAGVSVDPALRMINAIMLMKDDGESYATLDLAIVNRQSGRVKFYKIGAAPTLIKNRSGVEEVRLSAVPLGIVNGIRVRYMEATVRKGDWIIMMSDGVSDGGDAGKSDSGTLLKVIMESAADVRSQDPNIMSELLLSRAADSYIGRERDDLTVLAAHIV